MITMTSREFNQNKSRLMKEVKKGPVIVTHRGEPSMVVMTYEKYCSLNKKRTLAEAFADTGVGDIDFEIPRDNDPRDYREVEF